VFINHRGPDVKKTFASHLYRRLHSHGLRVFLDQPELQQGDYLTPQIEGAIESASVHVAIFSSGYAESTWCLKELVLMLESNSPIIPVFYHVKPAELRWAQGGYARALRELEKKKASDPQTREEKLRYDSSMIENWRDALLKVAGISGFELEACNGDEGELLDKVVEGVLKKVKKPALDVAKHPTGLDDKVNDFENTVLLPRQQSGKPQILGIVGLGGVGKTTLAKELFNRKSSGYSRSCFLCDVRDHAGKGSLNLLQRELLKTLTRRNEPIASVHEGKAILKKDISSPNLLIILDDVDKVDQVDDLLPDQTVLHSDSLILITSRSKDVLKRSGVEESSIYNLTGLTRQHSLELFCLYSFNQLHPLPEFESLVEKFIEACGGLPLSLKVFGALLNGENTSYWQAQLDKLQRILPEDIKQTLQISYDALDMEDRQIFLDITCFFIGEKRDMVTRIWSGSGLNGLCGFRNIQNKCLVEVDRENRIRMHDHLRDLGREIADASLPRRLWRPTEKIDDLLQQSSTEQVINEVRGIRMRDHTDGSAMPWYQRSSGLFGNCVIKLCNMLRNTQYPSHGTGICMRNLQLLDTANVLVECILTKVQSPNLIWLRWKDCPYSSLPSSISTKNLRVLRVQGRKLKTLWKNESQVNYDLLN